MVRNCGRSRTCNNTDPLGNLFGVLQKTFGYEKRDEEAQEAFRESFLCLIWREVFMWMKAVVTIPHV